MYSDDTEQQTAVHKIDLPFSFGSLFIRFDGINLPHGNEHIFIPRPRRIARIIDDVAVGITRVATLS